MNLSTTISTTVNDHFWLALMIGSSHLHWAEFKEKELLTAWDTPHLQSGSLILPDLKRGAPLWIASVVPEQTKLWQKYTQAKVITLDDLPLKGLYPTLGVDRALAALGAGEKFGFPLLVVDAGTALTFTGVNGDRQLVGGAILPGFRLQLQSLYTGTASLPEVAIPQELPPRWGLNTPSSIQSGVIYSIVAAVCDFIAAWWQDYPESNIVVTGGGGSGLLAYLRSRDGAIADRAIFDPHLVFWGMEMIVNG